MALGSIHSHVGGMAAGYHLKQMHGILMSLCSDPISVVHYYAIEALSQVAGSAGLTFSGYVSSTLGLLVQLWNSDTHNQESAMMVTSNFEFENSTNTVIGRCMNSLINVLGPDLQDLDKIRELMLTVIEQFRIDDVAEIQVEGLKAMEHMYLYDSGHVDFLSYVRQIQMNLDSPHDLIQEVAIDGLYNLVRRDAREVFKAAKESLSDQVWSILNRNHEQEGVINVVQAWLGQTGLAEPIRWIMCCQHVLTKTTTKQQEISTLASAKVSAAPDLQDEEVAGFASTDGKDHNSNATSENTQELLRWQVRSFALKCLNDLISMIGKDMEMDPESEAGNALQQKIADVIRMAFLASTSSVDELCVEGLRLIDQVLTVQFGSGSECSNITNEM